MRKVLLVSATTIVLSMPGYAQEGLEVSTYAGFGYDTNVFNSPSSAYVDAAKNTTPTIPANIQSGIFLPLKLDANLALESKLNLRYKFNINHYLASSLSNADTSNHKLSLESDGRVLSGSKFKTAIYAGIHEKKYLDRDTGAEQVSVVSGANLSNRYNYNDIGVEGAIRKNVRNMKLSLNTKLAVLTYDDPIAVASYDHTLFKIGGAVQTKVAIFGKKAKVKTSFNYTNKNYANRLARDINGRILVANNTLTYSYNELAAQLVIPVNKQLKVFADMTYSMRADDFVGYNDYTKNKIKVRVLYKHSGLFNIRGKASYSNTGYTNAFAFDNPAEAQKTATQIKLDVSGEYQLSQWGAPAISAGFNYTDSNTNDLRYSYSGTQFIAGGNWVF